MKKIGIVIVVVLIVLLGGITLLNNAASQQSNSPSSSPTLIPNNTSAPTAGITDCMSEDLQAQVELNPGAGNIFGTFTLKNRSNISCQIIGSNYISANYNTQTVKNITITKMGQVGQPFFQLTPGQTVYSQVHYPNGPQCSSSIQNTPVTFTYTISPNESVQFTNQNGSPVTVTTCSDPTEMTTIQIWNMSTQPITQ